MSKLLSKYHAPDASHCTQKITPESAGWDYVGFEAYEMKKGETLTLPGSDNEVCLVLVGGKATITTDTAKQYLVHLRVQTSCEHLAPC